MIRSYGNCILAMGTWIAVVLLISCGDDPNGRKLHRREPIEKTNFTKSVYKASCKLKYRERQFVVEFYIFFDRTHGCRDRSCGSMSRKRTAEYDGIMCECWGPKTQPTRHDEQYFTTKEEYQKFLHICFPYEPYL